MSHIKDELLIDVLLGARRPKRRPGREMEDRPNPKKEMVPLTPEQRRKAAMRKREEICDIAGGRSVH